jgi:hypothetical protein
MAKRPEDRFQSAGEMAESLALAVEGGEPALSETAAAVGPASPERATNRVIVTTAPNEPPRSTAETDADEVTVVHPRTDEMEAAVLAETVRAETEPTDSFNPWRIIIPAAAALLVAFVVVFALTRDSGTTDPNANQQTAPLVSDPNSQPVQPSQPPTGQSEQGITSSLPANASGANANQNANASGSPGADQTTSGIETTVPGDPNLNNNQGADQNDNKSDETKDQPNKPAEGNDQPDAGNKDNANRSETPTPKESPSQDNSNKAPAVPSPVKRAPTVPTPNTTPADKPAEKSQPSLP